MNWKVNENTSTQQKRMEGGENTGEDELKEKGEIRRLDELKQKVLLAKCLSVIALVISTVALIIRIVQVL